jgi:quinol monooxygenase YgiN
MLTIVAKNFVKPSEKARFVIAAKELIECSKKEEGCIAYDLYEDTRNENVLTFIECWQDKKAIDLHNKSEHFTRIVPQLGEFQAEASEISVYSKL